MTRNKHRVIEVFGPRGQIVQLLKRVSFDIQIESSGNEGAHLGNSREQLGLSEGYMANVYHPTSRSVGQNESHVADKNQE